MQDTHVLILTAGVLGVIFFALTIWVVAERYKTKQMLGDGGSQTLQIAIRAHANFAEFVPMVLILLAALAHEGANALFFLVLCVALVAGRVLHPLGIRILKPNMPRAVGAMLTWAVLIVASIAAIGLAFFPPV
jgi:uncharacterized membrane protein YecN with MAPEG domain